MDPIATLKLDRLHAAGYTGKGVEVAVLDSGFCYPDYELDGWKDILNGSASPNDHEGHGTHVTGLVHQAAPDARITVVKVADEEGRTTASSMIDALTWVREQNRCGAHNFTVVNMSIADRPDGWPDLWDPLNKAIEEASREGITVVAAAGNRGPNPRSIGSPGDAPSAITVGSVSPEGRLSEFSSRGPTDSQNQKPDVLAPGEMIASWNAEGSTLDRLSDTLEELRRASPDALKQRLLDEPELVGRFGLPHDEVEKMSAEQVAERFKPALPPSFQPAPDVLITYGTSMATPLVAGAVAVLQEAYPGLSPLEAKVCLRGTALPVTGDPMEEGAGLVDAARALGMAQSA